jgi:iron complex outermembrane receptor protein
MLPTTAFAQDSEPDSRTLDSVIVTMPGPSRSADELIGNATALDREDILERLQGTLGDTLAREPGVSTTFFGQGASRPVLRGLGAERVQVLTNGIGVIDASAASPDHQVGADGIDAEKIEILRGPAALAYGGQSIGGVVNVIDGLIAEDLPEKAVSGDLFAAYNDVNEGTELAGKAEFVAGRFVLNLSASQRDFGDFEIPGFAESARQIASEEEEHEGEDHDEDHGDEDHDDHDHEDEVEGLLENSFAETQTFAAGLSYIGERGFFGVSVRQQTAEYGLPGHSHGHDEGHDEGHDDHDDEKRSTFASEDDDHDHEGEEESPFIDLEHTRVDIRGGMTFGDTGITKVIAAASFVDYEHTEFEGAGEPGTVYESDGYEGRIEFDTKFGDVAGAFGAQILDKELLAFGDEAFITPTSTNSIAAFVYQTREWDNGFGIEGGARLEKVELDNIIAGTETFDLISGSIGAHRHLDNGWFIGGQLALTQRAPNESELFANGPHLATDQFEIGNRFLEKEQGINLEGTARWTGDNVSFGANLFVTEFSDFVYLSPNGLEEDELPVFLFLQDDATFVGGEIYARALFEDGPLGAEWSLDASVDFVDAELDNGENVPFLPPLTFKGGASAEWGAWEVGADVILAADQDSPGTGQFETDGYALLGLRAEVDLADFGIGADGTEAFIEARNVTDEEVRYATSVLKDVAPAPGRNIRVGLRLAF